ncbi:MAG: ABC transporter permease [Chloroflexota bacterium]|jgi:peptide/nickel transport system permease protein
MRRRSLIREVLASTAGKIGLTLGIILVAASILVVLVVPWDFGPSRWSNPSVWADYPKAVPPAWTAVLTADQPVEHQVIEASEPSDSTEREEARVDVYDLVYEHVAAEAPTFLSFSLADVSYLGRPPSLSVTLLRPDGAQVPLLRTTIRGPRQGEEPPFERHDETPLRVLLTAEPEVAQATSEMLAETYGVAIPARVLRDDIAAALFGAPDENGRLQPLPGTYTTQVRVALAQPEDSLGWVRTVVGGTVFGLLGTDGSGRDLAQGLAFGLPIALIIGLAAATVSTAIGTSLGMLSGYKGGRVDLVIQRTADVINNVPLLPLLIFFVVVFGAQLWLIVTLLVLFSWPGLTILVRSMVLGLAGSQEVEAARALGAPSGWVLRKHIFPHTAPIVFLQLIFFVPAIILAEAGLSFLGLGDPSLPTWGQILEDGFRTGAVFLGYWWWVVSPGLLIVITAVTFMLLALAMEPVVNPKLRRD